ncbi:hypothetical protein A33M_1215 [Rhodovulum sp. PH10]|uniref:NADase-type glycan-binding domain-containing protein n=1 Tax=Rhodovulum sp. PH10 TaxID=1187851 RepID=UPI00027C1F3C|nr:caspase family protein [Rhodovulum sp. PH10]EJW09522.1 hypothetical protein A33M_1215 [Rhodovulum sp. PH10]
MLAALGLVLALLSIAASPAAAQERVALVIGNGAYKNAPPLPNPPNDAADVAAALRRIGFTVFEGRDLDRRAMVETVRAFGRALDRAKIALFFYAGHGLQVNGKNYLVPVDASLERAGDLSFETIDIGQVLAWMEEDTRVNLVFLDACRNNPLARTLARSLGMRSAAVGQGLAQIHGAVGTMIAYATQPDNVALDGDGRNSPFTAALLKHLPTPGLDIAVLMRRIRSDVVEATQAKQVPWDHSSLIGDVVLVPSAPEKAPPAPVAPGVASLPGSDPRPAAVTTPPADAGAAGAGRSQAADIAYWNSVKDTGDRAQLESYLTTFPQGTFVALAHLRIGELSARAKSTPADAGRSDLAAMPPANGRSEPPHAPYENCDTFNAPAGTDTYCASSVLTPQYGNRYGVKNLFAGDPSAAWVEGVPGDGVGEWITVSFDGDRLVKSVIVHNGYQKSADLYRKNGRVARVRLIFSHGQTATFALKDQPQVQTILLDRPVRASWMQVVIERVFPGEAHSDTAISKLAVFSDRVE